MNKESTTACSSRAKAFSSNASKTMMRSNVSARRWQRKQPPSSSRPILQAPAHCRRSWPHRPADVTRCSPIFRKCGGYAQDDSRRPDPGMGGMPDGRCFPGLPRHGWWACWQMGGMPGHRACLERALGAAACSRSPTAPAKRPRSGKGIRLSSKPICRGRLRPPCQQLARPARLAKVRIKMHC